MFGMRIRLNRIKKRKASIKHKEHKAGLHVEHLNVQILTQLRLFLDLCVSNSAATMNLWLLQCCTLSLVSKLAAILVQACEGTPNERGI